MSEAEGLWGPAQVAAFLGYAESTVARMVTTHPEKLPLQKTTRLPAGWREVWSRPDGDRHAVKVGNGRGSFIAATSATEASARALAAEELWKSEVEDDGKRT